MFQRLLFGLCALLLLAPLSRAQEFKLDKDLDLTTIRHLPTLEGRRYKPFDSLAREWVRTVTYEAKFKKTDPALLYLHWLFEPEKAREEKFIHLPSAGAVEAMGFGETERKRDALWVSATELEAHEGFRNYVAPLRDKDPNKLTADESEALRFQNRLNHLRAVMGENTPGVPAEACGFLPIIPSKKAPGEVLGNHSWEHPWLVGALKALKDSNDANPMALAQVKQTLGWSEEEATPILTAFVALRSAYRANDKDAFNQASEQLLSAVKGLNAPEYPSDALMAREVKLNLANPFSHARWFYILGTLFALLAMLMKQRIVMILAALPLIGGLGYHGWGIWERTSLSQAMIGNYFESLLFFSAGAAAIGLVMGLWFQSRAFLVGGSTLGWLLMTAAVDSPGSWDTSIETLQPVLINNYWIHIHVPTIILSYAALGLTVILGHLYLLRYPFSDLKNKGMRSIVRNINRVMPVGVILIATGIVLGGVWADKSWGRFWGWDPKETWSFVTLLVFLIVVHGRWAGWLNDVGVALGTMVGGWALFWTYWGANFYQKGLHSYAGATADASLPTWLIVSTIIELGLFAVGLFFWFSRDKGEAAKKAPAVRGEAATSST